MRHSEIFQILKARYCFAAILIAWYWQPGSHLLAPAMVGLEWYWQDLFFHYYAHATLTLFLILAGIATRFEVSGFPGRGLVRQDLAPILFIATLAFCASSVINTITFVPLSYLFPGFVNWWLAWYSQPVVYLAADGAFPVGANILSFFSLVVLGPVLEECIFRGYLLHRWSEKWGLSTGVMLSSAAFGAIHPDTLAAAATGLGFAMLYLKSQTLWAPVAAHSTYNFAVWLLELYGVLSEGEEYFRYTIDQFREDWWIGLAPLVMVVLLVGRILKRKKPLGPFTLPALGS